MKLSKPKMLVFSHICSPQYVTGAEKLLLFMVRELLPSFACTLVVPNEGIIAANARKLGITVIVHQIPLVVPLYLGLSHMTDEIGTHQRDPLWLQLIRLIHYERPSIIIANTCVHPMPAIAGKLLGIPVVWTVMEAIRETPHTALAASVIEQYSDYIVGISETTLAPLRTPGMIPKSTLIPPSWHQSELNPHGWQQHRINRRKQLAIADEQRVVGYISSSIFELKGLEHFMQMAVNTAEQHPQAMYLIVGNPVDQGYFDKCIGIARDRGLMERFRWIRFEEQVETVYPAMDVLVVPSLTVEGFGMTALEGMVFGKPVVVYGSGGLSEIGRATGNEAYVVPVGDTGGLTHCVSSLLADEAAMQAIGARNVQAAHEVYGVNAYRDRLLRFIATLALRGYAPPTVLKGSGTPIIYKFDNGVLRPFRSARSFYRAGYRMDEIREVPDVYIAAWPKGEPIGTAYRSRRKGGKRLTGRAGKNRRRHGVRKQGSLKRRRQPGRQRNRARGAKKKR
ncbi:glycosyltransferase family 4 protein [Paenibacillus sp. CF384]|uniref:glycosyltransferase family 4 protein n=1 Tax=Paenibacillus sp. CF384 TaxID=1884382 RepID=UPI00089C1595|nr:glycosyltransferase family 4 protein [Paenibacillus sp. CF384]SDW81533.1 Glycosyltransferase involved in cell wall bisynthesis [Paenibacillus sp. CF384]